MLILSINDILNWCQITTGGRRYTCPTKLIGEELFFRFKGIWHPVANFLSEHTFSLVSDGGAIYSKHYKTS